MLKTSAKSSTNDLDPFNNGKNIDLNRLPKETSGGTNNAYFKSNGKSGNNRSRMNFDTNVDLLSSKYHKSENVENLFENIVGYDDIKKIFNYALNSSLPVHILLVGPPGSAKTLFLMECMKLTRSYFTLGSHSTKAGMLDYLFNNRPKNLVIDEIEYMAIKDQAALLSLMETGILSETKFEKTRYSTMRTWVFASCNDETKLLTPLLSRFFVLYFKKYDYKTFERISNHILKGECSMPEDLSSIIANLVWNKMKSRDIRDCIKIGRISKNKEDIYSIVKILKQYEKTDSVPND